jgi:Glucosyl transferase GtrII
LLSTCSPTNVSSDQSRDDSRVFLILLALYFLVLFPILRANRYYNDDLKRALIGRTGWDSNGRPLTNLLMKLLQCYDHALVDISPLTQIGAIAILAWVGVLIARRYAIGSPWMAALVAFPLGAQPFYLENLSYKFDALSMSVAMLLALLPIIALKDDRRGWWLGILALFASLNFYQPAINAYLIFILLDLVLAQLHDKTPRQLMLQLLSRALQAGVAMLFYQLIVGIHVNGWVKQKSETIHGLNELPLIITNFVDFYTFIGNSFNEQWWRYFAPVLIALALVPIVIGIRYTIKNRLMQPTWTTAILCAISFLLPVAALACVIGPMLVLFKPPIGARILMGIGALLAAALIVMQAALRQWRRSDKWTLSVASMLALGMCSVASAYGNALGAQKDYEDRIAAQLADDLAEFNTNDPAHSVLLDGAAGYSPITAHIAEQFPLIHSLVPPYIAAEDTFHTHIFLMYYLSDFTDMRLDTDGNAAKLASAILAKTCLVPATRSTNAYRLYVIDNTAVVTFLSAHTEHCIADASRRSKS